MKPKRRAGAKPPRRDRDRQRWGYPWNDLDVQLSLYFCPSLQRLLGKPPVVHESIDLIYPKLHKERKPS